MSIESRCASTLNRGKVSNDGTRVSNDGTRICGLGVPPCVDAGAVFNDGSPCVPGGSPKLSRSPRVPPTAAPYAGVGEPKTANGSSSSKSRPEELSRDKERAGGAGPDDGTSAPRAVFNFASKTFLRPFGIPISSATDCARFDLICQSCQTSRVRLARERAHLKVAFAKRKHGRTVQPEVEDHFSTLRERFALRQPALCHRADGRADVALARALTCCATSSARCAQSQERSCALAPLPMDRPVDRDLLTPVRAARLWTLSSLPLALRS